MVGRIDSARRRAGVSIHGYNLPAPNFEEVIWGIPPRGPGRLPKGLAIFYEQKAEFLAIGTGASRREADGKLEAAVIAEYLFEHFAGLADFRCVTDLLAQNGPDAEARARESLRFALRCKNTQEEAEEVAEIFDGLGVTHWTLVSSCDHISRVAKIAASLALKKGSSPLWHNISLVWSPVPCGMGPDRVVVLEAPYDAPELYTRFTAEVGTIANSFRTGETPRARETLERFCRRVA